MEYTTYWVSLNPSIVTIALLHARLFLFIHLGKKYILSVYYTIGNL